ncbi:phosphate ABC transporter substrate-binding protein [Polynucleobacter sp. JS-Polo-80-F4]|uniref:phosphate ABC transporter substrate-binding protein n=1 Tax=Polynucleobacter sp. JS-Polo-80-F4 TaxID=2576918 RepID=UPI001C0DEAE9|nr:phosphate ABC transporter substrate-binding protein [Polynucleobacter sp. JS-Polo-80-F4]MBU3617580.1 phosphate ABC transporter substrate-binding protein [Polynucleobacter sp. JS-Polo-80-F4]
MSNKSIDPTQLQFIQLRGSTTVMKLMQRIGMRYMDEHPNIHLPLVGGGTAMGYKSALDGTSTIGMASGQIPPNIQLWAHKHKIKIEEVTIAIDGLAAIVNRANPINDLTLEQLHDIFTGSITDWKSVGKYSGPINVISHDPQLGTYEPWKRQVAGKDHITLRAKVVSSLNGLMRTVTSDPFSIAYVGTTFLDKEKVKALSIDGVFPNYLDIKQRRYPICNELQLLTKPTVSKEVKDFIAYCLDKNAGQAMIKEMGLVPVVGE